jgi:hypothetical protein
MCGEDNERWVLGVIRAILFFNPFFKEKNVEMPGKTLGNREMTV